MPEQWVIGYEEMDETGLVGPFPSYTAAQSFETRMIARFSYWVPTGIKRLTSPPDAMGND